MVCHTVAELVEAVKAGTVKKVLRFGNKLAIVST
jgi:hypothetical protein